MMTTQQKIYQLLNDTFSPGNLTVIDDSDEHIGHAGSAEGKGHFTIQLTSSQFENVSRIECHRMIYAALGDLMQTEIHALQIIIL